MWDDGHTFLCSGNGVVESESTWNTLEDGGEGEGKPGMASRVGHHHDVRVHEHEVHPVLHHVVVEVAARPDGGRGQPG